MKISPINNYRYSNNNIKFRAQIQSARKEDTIDNLIKLGYLDRAIELGATDTQIRKLCSLPTEELYASYMTQKTFKERPECLSVLTEKLVNENKINKAITVCSNIDKDYQGLELSPKEVFALSKDTLLKLIALKTEKLKNGVIALGVYCK